MVFITCFYFLKTDEKIQIFCLRICRNSSQPPVSLSKEDSVLKVIIHFTQGQLDHRYVFKLQITQISQKLIMSVKTDLKYYLYKKHCRYISNSCWEKLHFSSLLAFSVYRIWLQIVKAKETDEIGNFYRAGFGEYLIRRPVQRSNHGILNRIWGMKATISILIANMRCH